MTDVDPARLAKLPAWAREHISELQTTNRTLERDLDAAQKAATAYGSGLVGDRGPSGFEVIVDDTIYVIPAGATVTAKLASEVELSVRNRELRIQGAWDLAVLPLNTYEIAVKIAETK